MNTTLRANIQLCLVFFIAGLVISLGNTLYQRPKSVTPEITPVVTTVVTTLDTHEKTPHAKAATTSARSSAAEEKTAKFAPRMNNRNDGSPLAPAEDNTETADNTPQSEEDYLLIVEKKLAESASTGNTSIPSGNMPVVAENNAEKILATPLILNKQEHQDKSYQLLLASTPTVTEALKMLQKPANSEIEVLRLMTLVDMITDGWSLSGGRNRNDNEIIINLLADTWQENIDVIIATNCTYCGEHYEMISRLILSSPELDTDTANRIAKIDPRYLQLIDQHQTIDKELKDKLIRSYAVLSYAGDSDTSQYMHKNLVEMNATDLLEQRISDETYSQLNIEGFRKLSDNEKDRLIRYWESSIARGGAMGSLTTLLAGNGHRPALRWMIWHLDGQADMTSIYMMPYHVEGFKSFIAQNTDFGKTSGTALSEYYSNNWDRIEWSSEKNRWLTH